MCVGLWLYSGNAGFSIKSYRNSSSPVMHSYPLCEVRNHSISWKRSVWYPFARLELEESSCFGKSIHIRFSPQQTIVEHCILVLFDSHAYWSLVCFYASKIWCGLRFVFSAVMRWTSSSVWMCIELSQLIWCFLMRIILTCILLRINKARCYTMICI